VLLPALIVVTPSDFVIARSARGTTVLVSVAESLAALLSLAYVTVAVFATLPVAAALTVHVALKLSVPLAAIAFVVVAMLPLPLAVWQLPPADALQVQEQPVSDAGNVSATATLLIATDAGLLTWIV
jgi:hypothetical protein